MSENSSDSDSSCGWTVINHEGSDIEMVYSEHGRGSNSCELTPEGSLLEQEEMQVLQLEEGESSQSGTILMEEAAHPPLAEVKSTLEGEEEKSLEDNVYFGTISDDSDIVTLEPPKVEEIGSQEALEVVKEAQNLEDFNMGSSSSSQYTFCQPETVFASQPSDDESSSDETSHQPSPTFKRRRAKKKPISTSDSGECPESEQEVEPSKELCKRQLSSGLNKCVILALVIAISMGFGHFYGTIQIQKRQVFLQ